MRGSWSALRTGVLALACLFLALPARAEIEAVTEIVMTVDDLDRSVAFFTDVLGFEKTFEAEVATEQWERWSGVFGARVRVARLRLGSETLELHDYLAPRGRPYPYDTRANDLWFQHVAIVVSDMDRAYARLREHGVEHASTGPQTLPPSIPAAAGIRAFYFRDPDGHFLELLEFPPGKGDRRWHETAGERDARGEPGADDAPAAGDANGGRLFLGIDHTAIVVADTERSLAFYRDRLGLRVAGTSENFGTEQEHLNNVRGARLRITTLRAASGPGVELLQYLAPSGGRAAPPDAAANDLASWRVRMRAGAEDDFGRIPERALRGSSETGIASFGIAKARLGVDADGHVVELVRGGDAARGEGGLTR